MGLPLVFFAQGFPGDFSTSGFGRQGELRTFGLPPANGRNRIDLSFAATEGEQMQYLTGFTVQCINPICEASSHSLRVDFSHPLCSTPLCPCFGASPSTLTT